MPWTLKSSWSFRGAARDKPSADLLAALAGVTLLRTDERGMIEMVVDGQTLRVGMGH